MEDAINIVQHFEIQSIDSLLFACPETSAVSENCISPVLLNLLTQLLIQYMLHKI
jgi:hypothetical protein